MLRGCAECVIGRYVNDVMLYVHVVTCIVVVEALHVCYVMLNLGHDDVFCVCVCVCVSVKLCCMGVV
jgi:hypothetical protein